MVYGNETPETDPLPDPVQLTLPVPVPLIVIIPSEAVQFDGDEVPVNAIVGGVHIGLM
jgi:hypothetical protein